MNTYYADSKDITVCLDAQDDYTNCINVGVGRPVLVVCKGKLYGFNSAGLNNVLYADIRGNVEATEACSYTPTEEHLWAVGVSRVTSEQCFYEDTTYTLAIIETRTRLRFIVTNGIKETVKAISNLLQERPDRPVYLVSDRAEPTPVVFKLYTYLHRNAPVDCEYTKYVLGGRPAWQV